MILVVMGTVTVAVTEPLDSTWGEEQSNLPKFYQWHHEPLEEHFLNPSLSALTHLQIFLEDRPFPCFGSGKILVKHPLSTGLVAEIL
jgi:hypothetical protein